MTDGATHTELKLWPGNDQPQVIEVNTRPGGGGIPRLVELVTGIDQYEQALRAQLNMDTSTQRVAGPPASGAGAASIFGIGRRSVDQVLACVPDPSRLSVVEIRTMSGDGKGGDSRNANAIVTAQHRDDLVPLLNQTASLFDADRVTSR